MLFQIIKPPTDSISFSSPDELALKGELLKQPNEEHPSKAPIIQTPNSSNIKDDSKRLWANSVHWNWSKIPNANRETKTPHTKENETITPIKKDIQTPLLQSRLNTAAHHQRHIWKVEAQIPVLKSYFTSQGSWHTSES